jgi:hypothetical protein
MFWKRAPQEQTSSLHCSFCNKSQRDVYKLIAGPKVYICDECVDICLEIINHQSEPESSLTRNPAGGESAAVELAVRCSICKLETLLSHALLLSGRGVLCAGCTAAVETALAERLPRPN